MGTHTRLVEVAFSRPAKVAVPPPTEDWAGVDFYPDDDRIVVLGYVRNGDSRHRFAPERVELDASGSDETLRVEVAIIDRSSADQLILGQNPGYAYRIEAAFDARIPEYYEITQFDADGNEQFGVTDVFLPEQRTQRHRER